MKLLDVRPEQHFTRPPPKYTEASLIKALEQLGIGRPSTYAATLKVLQASSAEAQRTPAHALYGDCQQGRLIALRLTCKLCTRISGKNLNGALSSLCSLIYAALSCASSHRLYEAGHMHKDAMSWSSRRLWDRENVVRAGCTLHLEPLWPHAWQIPAKECSCHVCAGLPCYAGGG